MTWEDFLREGEQATDYVYKGLIRRDIKVEKAIKTQFETDEDIVVCNNLNRKIFWISVKSIGEKISDPKNPPSKYRLGYLCGEVESKQWVDAPAIIIWVCLEAKTSWGAITPTRLSKEWEIFPHKYGIILDKRKSLLTGKNEYMYPSWRVPINCIISKEEAITYIQNLYTKSK